MPVQDSQTRNPESGAKAEKANGSSANSHRKTSPTGSKEQRNSRSGNDSACLKLAVNNGAFRKSLGELIGCRRTTNAHPDGSHATAEDASDGVSRVFRAQEENARRIAQSLHDEASQMLAIVYLELANIARNSPMSTAERIDRVIAHLDSVGEQIRGLSHELHPMTLELHGLLPALRQLAKGFKQRSGLDIRVVGEASGLPFAVEVGIYRVVQEALNNVVRHAGACKVEIRLHQTDERVFCTVRDDGKGFELDHPAAGERYGTGLGLVGMYERVDSLGGECHVLSDGRKGTEIEMGIPL